MVSVFVTPCLSENILLNILLQQIALAGLLARIVTLWLVQYLIRHLTHWRTRKVQLITCECLAGISTSILPSIST
jgi:hypothetical protein